MNQKEFYKGKGKHTVEELEIRLALVMKNGVIAQKCQSEILTVLSYLEEASHSYINGRGNKANLTKYLEAQSKAIDTIKCYKNPKKWALEKNKNKLAYQKKQY